jgi:hypothetical protein
MSRTILLLSATPRDAAPLRADEEMREIQDALARSRYRDEFVVVSRTAVRPRDVRHALLTYRPAIVHFSGHGRGAQGLVLEDDHGHSLPVAGDRLAELLALAGKTRIECVLLNACHSQAQIDSIAQHVPFVIGMSEAVHDRAGIVFAAAFYQGLGNGESIPCAYELGCNATAMAGLAVDRVAVLAQRPMALSEGAGVARHGSIRRAKRAMAAAAAFVGVSSLLGFAALKPELTIPMLSHGPGGVVLAVDAGATPRELHIYQALCEDLRVQAPQEVRCVELPRFGIDHEELLRRATQARASLLVRVMEEQELGMFPVSAEPAPLLASIPKVHVPSPDASQALAPVVLALSRVMAGALDMNAGRVPPPDPDLVGWRVATLAWYLAVLAGDHAVLPPKLVHGAMQRCRQEVTLADVYCALAHYVHAQLEPTPPDARAWLEELVAHGPAWFHDSLLLELAADDCTADAEGTTALLLRMAAAWQRAPCRRMALIGVASCVVAQGRGSEAAEQLRPIAYPRDEEIDQCPAAVRAAAFSERAAHNMLASQWHQAEQDFGNAWRLGGDPADLLNWAEAVLHQRHQRDDVRAVVGSSLDVRHFDGAYRLLAVFLRWLATQADQDGAQLLELYAALPLHGSALIDDGETLLGLACSEDPAAPACHAYRIMREPKGPDSIDSLRRVLVAARQ